MKKAWSILLVLTLAASGCGDTASEEVATVSTTLGPSESDGSEVTVVAPDESLSESSPSSTTQPLTIQPATTQTSTTATETTVDRSDDSPPEKVPAVTGQPAVGEVPQQLLSDIQADLAQRSGVAASDQTIVRAEQVIWPDGSLGCPEPGQAYTQATVDGYWVVIEAVGKSWDYRASATGFFVYCVVPPPGGAPTG